MIDFTQYRDGVVLSTREIIRLINFIEKRWEEEGFIKMFEEAQETDTFDLLMKFREIRHKVNLQEEE